MTDSSKAKFSNAQAQKLYERFQPDEDFSVGDGLGWFGMYLVPERGGAILHEDAMGFVTVDQYASASEIWLAWEEAKSSHEPQDEEPADDDYIIADGHQVFRGGKPLDAHYSYRSALVAIEEDMEKEQFWPNVWLASERGNYTKLTLAEELATTDQEEDEPTDDS